MDTDIIRKPKADMSQAVVVISPPDTRKHLAQYDIFWWLIGCISFTIVVDFILLCLNWIRI